MAKKKWVAGGDFKKEKQCASSVMCIEGIILGIMFIEIISTSRTVLRNIVLLNSKTLRNLLFKIISGKKKNKVGGITLSNFNTYYKTTIIKTVWCFHKDRHIGQWNITESPEISPYIYSQLIFNKEWRVTA